MVAAWGFPHLRVGGQELRAPGCLEQEETTSAAPVPTVGSGLRWTEAPILFACWSLGGLALRDPGAPRFDDRVEACCRDDRERLVVVLTKWGLLSRQFGVGSSDWGVTGRACWLEVRGGREGVKAQLW